MLRRIKSHLSYSNVVSTLCLFALLGGGAYAANKITSKDLAKNSVKSKAIKNGQVKTKDLKLDAVTSEQIADGAVGASDLGADSVGSSELGADSVGSSELAPDEAIHIVGTQGEPAYGNGVEGDCVWGDVSVLGTGIELPGYYKDLHGRVHIRGVVAATEVPAAGDGECGITPFNAAESSEDNRVFTLPAAYRPAESTFMAGNNTSTTGLGAFVVAGQDGLVAGAEVIPPGVVYATSAGGTQQVLGGSWLAADAGSRSSDGEPDKISAATFRELIGR